MCKIDMRSITVTSNVSGLLVNSPEMRQEVYFFHLAPPLTELWMRALCDVTKGHRTSQTLVTAPAQRAVCLALCDLLVATLFSGVL